MSWEPINHTRPRARKAHLCIWCGESILKGSTHARDVGRYCGDFQSNRYHHECYSAAQRYFLDDPHGVDGFTPHDHPRGGIAER